MKILEMFMFKYVFMISAFIAASLSNAAEPYRVGDVFYCIEKAKVFKSSKDHKIGEFPSLALKKFMFKIVDEETLSFGEDSLRTAKITSMSERIIKAEDVIKRVFFFDGYYTHVNINAAGSGITSAECERF